MYIGKRMTIAATGDAPVPVVTIGALVMGAVVGVWYLTKKRS